MEMRQKLDQELRATTEEREKLDMEVKGLTDQGLELEEQARNLEKEAASLREEREFARSALNLAWREGDSIVLPWNLEQDVTGSMGSQEDVVATEKTKERLVKALSPHKKTVAEEKMEFSLLREQVSREANATCCGLHFTYTNIHYMSNIELYIL
ncbi:unnamed protein product [Linum trigynum]|uniref:Uncharacterized protein n=1 Tax=Linum trigynum TaxID=586398 RepID=A0AAV2CMP7_9ROSI